MSQSSSYRGIRYINCSKCKCNGCLFNRTGLKIANFVFSYKIAKKKKKLKCPK